MQGVQLQTKLYLAKLWPLSGPPIAANVGQYVSVISSPALMNLVAKPNVYYGIRKHFRARITFYDILYLIRYTQLEAYHS